MPPESLLLLIVLAALTLYALLGGADFGAGVWEFNSAMQASPSERQLMARAIAPVWEVNHVWLIFVLVLVQTGFPLAFSALAEALWLPLLLALVGIVFRGASFAFRSVAAGAARQQAAWNIVFALASTAAPFFLGASVGAIAAGLDVTETGEFVGDYLLGWLNPLSLFTAFFAVGMCAYLSAVYLTREAFQSADRQPDMVELWRRRALATGAWLGVLAAVGVVLLALEAPKLWEGFRARAWPLVGMSLACGFASLAAIAARRFNAGVICAALTVATVLWGWGVAQYPLLVPPRLTIETAKSGPAVLRAALWATAGGAALLAPSLGWLFYLFKWGRQGP